MRGRRTEYRLGRCRWWLTVTAGCSLFQLGGCAELASETIVRIGITTLFLPINNALAGGLTT